MKKYFKIICALLLIALTGIVSGQEKSVQLSKKDVKNFVKNYKYIYEEIDNIQNSDMDEDAMEEAFDKVLKKAGFGGKDGSDKFEEICRLYNICLYSELYSTVPDFELYTGVPKQLFYEVNEFQINQKNLAIFYPYYEKVKELSGTDINEVAEYYKSMYEYSQSNDMLPDAEDYSE